MDLLITTQEATEITTTEALTVAPEVEVCRVTVVRRSGTQETRAVTELVRHNIETTDEHFGEFRIVAPELLERLRLKGWFYDDEDWNLVIKAPFEHIMGGKPYRVVRFKSYDNSLFDAEGLQLPVAARFNYIDGRVNDYSFDLNGLLKHLQEREDVTIQCERFSDREIHRIPSYNSGDTCGYHGLSFIWHPDADLFRQYIAAVAKMDQFDRRAVAHTLMGNDQFRVEPPPEKDQEQEDDDQ